MTVLFIVGKIIFYEQFAYWRQHKRRSSTYFLLNVLPGTLVKLFMIVYLFILPFFSH